MNAIFDQKKTRICEIIRFAYVHSRFYNRLYKENGFNLNNIDMLERLPIIDHTVLIENPYEIKSDLKMYKLCASSGTTFSPKIMYRTYDDFNRSVLNEIELLRMSGVRENDIVAIVQPFGIWGYGEITQEAVRRYNATAIPLWNIEDEIILDMLIMNNVTVLDISPSRLIKILQTAKRNNRLQYLKIRTVMCAGEYLSIETMKKMERIYDIKIYSQYGCEELDGLGGTDDDGKMKLFTNDFVFEVWNEEEKRACNAGETGTLLVTSLYHKGTPLIRYNLQDLVRLNNRNEIELLGRKGDCVCIYDSVKLFPYQIDSCVQKIFAEPINWQCYIIQEKGKIVIMVRLLVDSISNKKREVTIQELKNVSIDINDLVLSNKISFDVEIVNPNCENSVCRKIKKIIDMRK